MQFLQKIYPYRRPIVVMAILLWWFSLPCRLFDDPISTVIYDNKGNLLGAKIAEDGQWRFPYRKDVPEKFKECILAFEDKRFYSHPGVDPIAMGRAMWLNLTQMRRVSGGSTLSMQVIRLSRKGKSRSVFEKLIEITQATRMEFTYDKDEILALYASHAPYGGNVVGLEAAAWRYFGRNPYTLSWAEMATLAVLPNSPSIIHPGKNRQVLKNKRDFLLDKLFEKGLINDETRELSKLEPLPEQPHPLPMMAPHLLARIEKEKPVEFQGGKNTTTIDAELQRRVSEVAERHHHSLKGNDINNLSIVVADVETGNVLAYLGNAPNAGYHHGQDVDIVTSPRSTGSIMKPFLFAGALDGGTLLPQMLLPDVPSYFGGYVPRNFEDDFAGAIPASKALARSLNIPHVYALQDYGIPKFHDQLKRMGMTTLKKGPDHYGLTMILGGAEATLWDLCGMYASMARTMNHYNRNSSHYLTNDWRPLNYIHNARRPSPTRTDNSIISAGAIWSALNAMQEVVRPEVLGYWERFASSRKVAWKTGTSFGYRDAWAIGVTPRHVVGVWVGNADGEGKPGLMGALAAAPLMFDVYEVLDQHRDWFEQPFDDMEKIEVCSKSGHIASELCDKKEEQWVPKAGKSTSICPYHQKLHLDSNGQYQVHSGCESTFNMTEKVFFILPPLQESYFKNHHPDYAIPPPFRSDCDMGESGGQRQISFIYPTDNSKIFVPTELDGKRGKVVFEARHKNPNGVIYWHLDGQYLTQTKGSHQLPIDPDFGKHEITIVDESGFSIRRHFETHGR